ncbi:hypothetical protein CDD83_2028 [Cordyceps sp. RAO-2017]|nr:hypothetical protein CDD83_2028 [Cordyceps sp. RAO-2017]
MTPSISNLCESGFQREAVSINDATSTHESTDHQFVSLLIQWPLQELWHLAVIIPDIIVAPRLVRFWTMRTRAAVN